jgi:hypothetical protein
MINSVPLRISVAACAIALMYGCGESPSSPASPSAIAAVNRAVAATSSASTSASIGASGHGQREVRIFDACDPDSFNAALGAGTCLRNGGLLFDLFIDQLRRNRSVGAWRFTPPQAGLGVGDVLLAANHGGETHTFTEVEEYGGGIVPMLNELSGMTTVAPECGQLQPADFIPPGGTSSETEDEEGVEKYQCCIHPWMRAEVRIGKQ